MQVQAAEANSHPFEAMLTAIQLAVETGQPVDRKARRYAESVVKADETGLYRTLVLLVIARVEDRDKAIEDAEAKIAETDWKAAGSLAELHTLQALNHVSRTRAIAFAQQHLKGSDENTIRAFLELAQCYQDELNFAASREVLAHARHLLKLLSEPSDALRSELDTVARRCANNEALIVHGPGFVLFKKARERQLRQDWNGAIQGFDVLLARSLEPAKEEGPWSELIEPIYTQAARFYRMECISHLGNARAFEEAFLEYTNEAADTPYTGEAYLIAGRQYGQEGDNKLPKAIQTYTNGIRWAERYAAAPVAERFDVPPQSEEATAAAADMRSTDNWGNVRWSKIGPTAIVHRGTCPWYMKNLLIRLYVERALCHFAAGMTDEAMADLDSMIALDDADAELVHKGLPSNYRRLRDGFKTGRMMASKEEMAHFKGKARLPFLYAEMYFETEQWDRALAAYRELKRAHWNRLSREGKAYLTFVTALAQGATGDRKARNEQLTVFTKKNSPYERTPTWHRALIVCSDIDRAKGVPALRQAIPKISNKAYKAACLLKLAQHEYVTDDTEAAVLTLQAVIEIAPSESWEAKVAQGFINKINALPKELPNE
jgi:tetratricopeptide (TPR) repeat protein